MKPLCSTLTPISRQTITATSTNQYAFAEILIDKHYDEAIGITHCTYATPFETYTFEIKGHFTCPATAAAPRS